MAYGVHRPVEQKKISDVWNASPMRIDTSQPQLRTRNVHVCYKANSKDVRYVETAGCLESILKGLSKERNVERQHGRHDDENLCWRGELSAVSWRVRFYAWQLIGLWAIPFGHVLSFFKPIKCRFWIVQRTQVPWVPRVPWIRYSSEWFLAVGVRVGWTSFLARCLQPPQCRALLSCNGKRSFVLNNTIFTNTGLLGIFTFHTRPLES